MGKSAAAVAHSQPSSRRPAVVQPSSRRSAIAQLPLSCCCRSAVDPLSGKRRSAVAPPAAQMKEVLSCRQVHVLSDTGYTDIGQSGWHQLAFALLHAALSPKAIVRQSSWHAGGRAHGQGRGRGDLGERPRPGTLQAGRNGMAGPTAALPHRCGVQGSRGEIILDVRASDRWQIIAPYSLAPVIRLVYW